MKTFHFVLLLVVLFSLAFSRAFKSPQSAPASQQKQNSDKVVAANMVFKSTDGGQTWQDISEGLPENLQEDGLTTGGFFADNNGLYLRAGNKLYHTKPNSAAPFWEKEIFPDEHSSIAPGKNGIFSYDWDGQVLQKMYGTDKWAPVYSNFPVGEVRNVFETGTGNIFIGCEKGLFKSTNSGKTWKQVQSGGWVIKLEESHGVLLATSQQGILRSTDDGESWDVVISQGGVGIAVESINRGFAAISCNTTTMSRRIHISQDGGKTWRAIDEGLPPSLYISSIKQVGEYLVCGHPDGIYRSPDMGRTWTLLLPSIENKVLKLPFVNTYPAPPVQNKVFNVSVSGDVIYAIALSAGC